MKAFSAFKRMTVSGFLLILMGIFIGQGFLPACACAEGPLFAAVDSASQESPPVSSEGSKAQSPEPPLPATVKEAVAVLVAELDEPSKKLLCSKSLDALVEFHFGWGMGIRNSFGLWGRNEPLLLDACGGKRCHPDNASTVIIRATWQDLQDNYCPGLTQ